MTDNRYTDSTTVTGSTANEPAAPTHMAGDVYAADNRDSLREPFREDVDYDRQSDLGSGETRQLIAADKVHGTSVYDDSGEKIGSVDSVMIDKVSGKVAYAVMSFGGFLGIGERYHPLPWDALRYDTDLGGYRVNQPADRLRDAPSYDRDEVDRYDYDRRGSELSGYYGFQAL